MGLGVDVELAEHRLAVILINPNKLRMSPLFNSYESLQHAEAQRGIVDEWRAGRVSLEDLVSHEGKYAYSYRCV